MRVRERQLRVLRCFPLMHAIIPNSEVAVTLRYKVERRVSVERDPRHLSCDIEDLNCKVQRNEPKNPGSTADAGTTVDGQGCRKRPPELS